MCSSSLEQHEGEGPTACPVACLSSEVVDTPKVKTALVRPTTADGELSVTPQLSDAVSRKSSLWLRRRGTTGSMPTEIHVAAKPVVPLNLLNDKYKVLEKLGSGCACMVHRAIHLETGHVVAIKTLRIVDSDMSTVMRQEYELLKRLEPHPHIIRAVDFHDLRGEAALVLEFFTGVSLQMLVEDEKRLSESTAHRLCNGLFKAVSHLHSQEVIHRDIKPQNLLISNCHQDLRLIDFNTAASLEEGEPLTPAGSPLYKPPEVLLGQPSGKYSDVWASGMCIFFALSGRLPQGRHCLEPGTKIRDDVAQTAVSFSDPSWENVSDDCKAMLQRSLAVARMGRPTIEDLLIDPWVLGCAPTQGNLPFLRQVVPGAEAWTPSIQPEAVRFCVESLKSIGRALLGQGCSSP